MFDTMKVARKIREARISQNMTQMNLADAMEVSYQAVSNWERGNSMPDIAKLEQLCQLLHLSLEELLGTDSSKTLNRIIKKEETPEPDACPITLQEIQEIAPILPPNDVEKLVADNIKQQEPESLNLNAILSLAPFLDSEYLDSLVNRANVKSLAELTGLAPFLSEDTLNSLALNADINEDMNGITSLAPFLFEDTLDSLVLNADLETEMPGITSLAPFLSQDTLDALLEKAMGNSNVNISALYPFFPQESLQKLAETLVSSQGLNALKSVTPYL